MDLQKGIKPLPPNQIDPANFIKFVSKDAHEFIIDKECARVCKTVRNALAGENAKADLFIDENSSDGMPKIKLPIKATLLEKVVQYCYYKMRYDNNYQNRPEFQVPPEMAMELIQAANYLQC